MTEPMETKLRENLTEKHKSMSNDKDIIVIPEENKKQIEDIWYDIILIYVFDLRHCHIDHFNI